MSMASQAWVDKLKHVCVYQYLSMQQLQQICCFYLFLFVGYRNPIVVHSYQARKPAKTPDKPEVYA